MSSVIQWERHGVYVKTTGVVTFEETYKLTERLYLNPVFQLKPYQIYDFLETIRFEQSDESIRFHAALSRAKTASIIANKRRVAFVVQPKAQNFKLFNIFKESLNSRKIETEVFSTETKARTWAENSTFAQESNSIYQGLQ